jgi:hypothetical protein
MEDRDFVDLWATSVQHQIDHLAGKMYFDHLSPLKRKMLIAKIRKAKAPEMKIIFMGTPDFSVRCWTPCIKPMKLLQSTASRRAQPGAARRTGQARFRPVPMALGSAGAAPGFAAQRKCSERLRRAGGGCGGCGRLWPDPAAGDPGCAAPWLPEHPRLAFAALAGGGTHPPGDHGGGPKPASASCRWRRGWTPGRSCCAKACRSGPRKPRRELHDRLSRPGRAADRAGAGPPAPCPPRRSPKKA